MLAMNGKEITFKRQNYRIKTSTSSLFQSLVSLHIKCLDSLSGDLLFLLMPSWDLTIYTIVIKLSTFPLLILPIWYLPFFLKLMPTQKWHLIRIGGRSINLYMNKGRSINFFMNNDTKIMLKVSFWTSWGRIQR